MNYRKIVPKSQELPKACCRIFYPYDIDEESRYSNWNQNYYQVISIDPSIENFGFRIERRYLNIDDPTVTGKIDTLVYERITFESKTNKTTKTGRVIGGIVDNSNYYYQLYDYITRYLDQYSNYFPTTHFIIMEEQLPQQYKCVRVSQHVISYFLLRKDRFTLCPHFIELNSDIKYSALGCPKGLNTDFKKKWGQNVAYELSNRRKDTVALDILDSNTKLDDLADTLIQIEAWFKLLDLPLTPQYSNPDGKDKNIFGGGRDIINSCGFDLSLRKPKTKAGKTRAKLTKLAENIPTSNPSIDRSYNNSNLPEGPVTGDPGELEIDIDQNCEIEIDIPLN